MKLYKKPMNVTVRPADSSDIEAILKIVNQAIANTTAIYDYDQRSYIEQKQWFEERTSMGFPVLVAEFNGEITGFGSYGTFRQKIGYRFTVEHSVYVSDGFEGKGIGTKILSELISIAKQNNIHVMIGAIDSSNKGSIAFHRNLGFSEIGVMKEVGFKFGKWLDVTFMQLTIAN